MADFAKKHDDNHNDFSLMLIEIEWLNQLSSFKSVCMHSFRGRVENVDIVIYGKY